MNSKSSNSKVYLSSIPLPEFNLWKKIRKENLSSSFNLEITARCNNNCRHCYINLPANDRGAQQKELSFTKIQNIVDEAVDLGALWCLITGGEPLLRKDFFDIYLYLKKRGLMVSVFTNATLITNKHIDLFKQYPPRDIEVTVYGVTAKTYEKVTRLPGSFQRFKQGLELLLENGIKVRFKAMILRSNLEESVQITKFCKKKTKDYFRFDPFLRLRLDRDLKRNDEIRSERLNLAEIVAIERADLERFGALEKSCKKLIQPQFSHKDCRYLFRCSAGSGTFTIGYNGFFRLCFALTHPKCVYDLKNGTLRQALQEFVPKIKQLCSDKKIYLDRCSKCGLINLCFWCPAHAYLETGKLDQPVEYFCQIAHARVDSLLSK